MKINSLGNGTAARQFGWAGVVLMILFVTAGCGGGAGGGSGSPSFSVGGTVSGLTGAGLVLQNNDGDNRDVAAAEINFTFVTKINDGGTYKVTVLTQPVGQTCTVTNGVGNVAGADVSNVAVTCTTLPTGIASSVSAGGHHTCALLSNGTVQCWGVNLSGQLGNGTTTFSSTPVAVSGITTATAVSAGNDHTCAVLSNGTVQCWGDNLSGQLGNGGAPAFSSTPVAVSGITTATAVAAGDSHHTCARLENGTVQCWGDNFSGQLGNGTRTFSSTPVAVSGITTATAVSAGVFHTCASLENGTVQCWGYNAFGRLGNGTTTSSSTPVPVIGAITHV